MSEDEKKWFAIHILSGHEKKVKAYLESEVKTLGLQDKISQVLIPSEEVTEMKEGKRRVKNRVFFPGYMLVEMVMDKETRHVILNIPGVTNFVGPKNNPEPLHQEEIDRILGRVESGKEKVVLDVPFRLGDPIKVTDGPFSEFTGFVEEINKDKKKVKVMVSIFGRATPVELDFMQVELEK
ncbi:MAG: transcription termination/antitermination protein NusG [bacterium]